MRIDLQQPVSGHVAQLHERIGEILVEADVPGGLGGRNVQLEVTDEAGDHVAANQIVAGQLDAAEHRQTPGVEIRVILLQPTPILAVGVVDLADRGHTDPDQIAIGMGRVTLEVAIEGPGLLGAGQLVVGAGEMVHAI